MASRKEAIVQVATRLFAEKGFKETSVAEISGLTGVAEGTIFYHFKSKEELLIFILQRLREEIVGEFQAYLETREPKPGLALVEDAISFYLALAANLEDRFLLLHRHYLYKLAQENSACRDHLEAIYNCLVDIFEEAIVQGCRDGSVAAVSPRKAAMLIFTMVDGLVRFKNYQLYDAAALYSELIAASRRMLQRDMGKETPGAGPSGLSNR